VYAFGTKAGRKRIRRPWLDKVEEIPAGRHAAGRGRRPRVLGVICLKDIVKGGIKERFAQLRKMGIRTVMITGDNR
jgi:P-type E1-E2 ATPase